MAMLNNQRVIDLLLKLAPPLRTDLKIPGQHCNILYTMQELSRYYLWSAAIFTPKIMFFQVGLWNLYQHGFGMFGIQRVDSSMEESSTWCWIHLGKSIATSLLSMMVTSGKSFIRRGFLLERLLIHVS